MQSSPLVQGATIGDVFDSTAVRDEDLLSHFVFKFIGVKLGKAPLLGDMDLLAARELELGSAQGFNHMLFVLNLGADGHDDLADVDSGHRALRLSEGTSHTGLQPVRPSTGQHLVDADDMEGMEPHSDVKSIFATAFHHILVGTNSRGLQGFRGQLLVVVGHHVATEWELVHLRLLPTQVKDADLGIWDTSAEARLRIRLVLAVPVTASRTAPHGETSNGHSGRERHPAHAAHAPDEPRPSTRPGTIES